MVGCVRNAGTGGGAWRCIRWMIRGATALCLSHPVGNLAAYAVIVIGASLTQITTSQARDNSGQREAQRQLAAQQRAQRQAEAALQKQVQAQAKAAADFVKRQAKEAQDAARLAKKQQDDAAKAAADLAKKQAKEAENAARLAKKQQDDAAKAAAEQQRKQAAAETARQKTQERQPSTERKYVAQRNAPNELQPPVTQTWQKAPQTRVTAQPTKGQIAPASADDGVKVQTPPVAEQTKPAERNWQTDAGAGNRTGRWRATPSDTVTSCPQVEARDVPDQAARGWTPRQHAREPDQKPTDEASPAPAAEVVAVPSTAPVDQVPAVPTETGAAESQISPQ